MYQHIIYVEDENEIGGSIAEPPLLLPFVLRLGKDYTFDFCCWSSI